MGLLRRLVITSFSFYTSYMKSPESSPVPHQVPPKQENVDQGRRGILRMFGAATVGAGLASMGASVHAGENLNTKKEGMPTTFKELETKVNDYIKSLGLLGKLALVNELKKKAESILSVLRSKENVHSQEAERIALSSGTEVKTVLTTYIEGVKSLPNAEEPQAVSKMIELVEYVKDTSLDDLRKRFS